MHASDHIEDLPLYRDWAPTGFDVRGLSLEDRQDWRIAPCSITRDSGILDTSNWETMIACFETIDPNGDDFERHSFGHWACGYFEIVIVRPGSKCEIEAAELMCALADYPVLNDDDFSAREYDAIIEAWENLSIRDRIRVCDRAGVSIFAARREEVPSGVYSEHLLGC